MKPLGFYILFVYLAFDVTSVYAQPTRVGDDEIVYFTPCSHDYRLAPKVAELFAELNGIDIKDRPLFHHDAFHDDNSEHGPWNVKGPQSNRWTHTQVVVEGTEIVIWQEIKKGAYSKKPERTNQLCYMLHCWKDKMPVNVEWSLREALNTVNKDLSIDDQFVLQRVIEKRKGQCQIFKNATPKSRRGFILNPFADLIQPSGAGAAVDTGVSLDIALGQRACRSPKRTDRALIPKSADCTECRNTLPSRHRVGGSVRARVAVGGSAAGGAAAILFGDAILESMLPEESIEEMNKSYEAIDLWQEQARERLRTGDKKTELNPNGDGIYTWGERFQDFISMTGPCMNSF